LFRNIINSISAALPEILNDPRTNVIVIRGSGGKAFCAGGDIKALHGAGQQVIAPLACVSSFLPSKQHHALHFRAQLPFNVFVFSYSYEFADFRQTEPANAFLQVGIPR
jgi:enoyl-CoA hydratase/carnithine racemase